MAKIAEILSIEKERSDASTQQIVHLFKEGGFYRAYNWSAWILVMMLRAKEHDEKKQLCVSRKTIKSSGDDFVFVGFPLKSINKFIPQDVQFTPVNDSQIDMVIDPTSFDTELSIDAFEEWKKSFPISEKKEKPTDTAASQPRQGLTALMSEVLKYPLESRTPLQNTEFISYLKQQLASLL